MIVVDPVLDGIFHNRLKNHARHLDLFQGNAVPDPAAVVDIAGEADIQDIDIIVHRGNLLLQSSRSAGLLNIIAEKIRHAPKEIFRFFRSFQHGQLGPGVEAVKEEMRIDLGLQISQLRFPEVRCHREFLLLHTRLGLQGGTLAHDIQADAVKHLAEGVCHDPDLIVRHGLPYGDVQITLRHAVCRAGKRCQGTDHRMDKERSHAADQAENNQDQNQAENLHLAESIQHQPVILRILPEAKAVEFVDVGTDIPVDPLRFFIKSPVFLNISPAFGLNRRLRVGGIIPAHQPDIALQHHGLILYNAVVQLLRQVHVFLFETVKVFQGAAGTGIQIFVDA